MEKNSEYRQKIERLLPALERLGDDDNDGIIKGIEQDTIFFARVTGEGFEVNLHRMSSISLLTTTSADSSSMHEYHMGYLRGIARGVVQFIPDAPNASEATLLVRGTDGFRFLCAPYQVASYWEISNGTTYFQTPGCEYTVAWIDGRGGDTAHGIHPARWAAMLEWFAYWLPLDLVYG